MLNNQRLIFNTLLCFFLLIPMSFALADSLDLTGIWKNPNDREPSVIIIEQLPHHRLRLTGSYKDLYNHPLVWHGKGNIVHDRIFITYRTDQTNVTPPETGELLFRISKDPNDIDGHIIKSSGHFKQDIFCWIRQQ